MTEPQKPETPASETPRTANGEGPDATHSSRWRSEHRARDDRGS